MSTTTGRTAEGAAREAQRKRAIAPDLIRAKRARDKEQGIVPLQVRAHEDDKDAIRRYAARLLQRRGLE